MMKKIEGFSFKNEYKKSWDYIKKSKNFIYIGGIIFFVFTFIAFIFPIPEFFSEQLLKIIQELVDKTKEMSQGELVNYIFFNNLKSSFFGIILGIAFGIFPILFAIFNGYLLGFVALMAVNEAGILSMWRILPHGIFELPAIFISLGLGLKLATFVFQKNRSESLKDFLWNSFRVFLFIVVPLLVIAAIIEGSLIAFAGG